MQNKVSESGWNLDLEAYLKQTSAYELVRRSLLGAPVFVVISLIMLVGTPILADYGWWAVGESGLLVLLGVIRVLFALSFKRRYESIGEKAIVQYSVLTALQSLTLGVLAGMVIYKYWAAREVVLTIVLSAGVIAASTSALSVRRSAHVIFLLCVLGPFGVAIFLVGGIAKSALIIGYLMLMAFLVQDGGQARQTNIQRMKDHYSDQEERIRAQNELRKLALAVEQSPESIIITNLNAEIEYVNEAFVKTSGYSREEVMGKNPRINQSGKTPSRRYEAMWDALTQGRSWKGVLYNEQKDGSELVEMVLIAPLSQPDGTITHYVSVQEDITQKKQLAEELENHRHHLEELVEQRTEELAEAREQAEAANQAKSTFLANMSHEIRTPMTAIMGFASLLRCSNPTPEQAQQLSMIEAAAGDLLYVINEILDLAKVEAGKLTLNQSDVELNEIFKYIQSLLKEQVKSKELTIEVDLGDVPTCLWGDPIRLRQALLNYGSNAVKFTERGKIILRARKMEEQGDEILVRFEVQDTGIGIELEELPRLFEAFEQANDSNTRNHGGTGLGLTITRHLAELMGGEAGVESEPGRGSTFWFSARLRHGHAMKPDIPPAEEVGAKENLRTQFRGSHILLVEDNVMNRNLVLVMLNDAGLVVDTAIDGVEALANIRANAYDLILMDIRMPRMDGFETTRVIRSMAGNTSLPILAMTANVFEDNRQACLEAGMNDFIAKPINPDHLYLTIAKWLSKKENAGSGDKKFGMPMQSIADREENGKDTDSG